MNLAEPHTAEPQLASPQAASWSSIPVETLNPLLTRQFINGEQAMLARIELKQGCHVPLHSHANEQISYIISGALRFLLGDGDTPQEVILRTGGLLVIPGNLPHAAIALEDTVNLDVFAPPRQDWLTGSDAYLR